MATTSMTKAKGLFTFQNYLSAIPEGAQLVATNVNIDRDGILEPRRGIKVLGETYDIPKQLLTFKNTILVHSNDVIQYSNNLDPATFTTFKGKTDFSPMSVNTTNNTITINLHGLNNNDVVMFTSSGTLPTPLVNGVAYFVRNPTQNTFQVSLTSGGPVLDLTTQGSGTNTIYFDYEFDEVEPGLRIKYIEMNGNLYITTLNGIKKIVANTEYAVTNAGGIKAQDIDLALDLSSAVGFLGDQQEVAYRVVWGTKDINDNLILGVPSYRAVIQNASAAARNVFVTFTVPNDITTDYFYQIYRTNNAVFNGSGDEMRLVYEAAYTGGTSITVLDEQPEDIRNTGTPLYTNEFSGEGALQANDAPPISHDISIYKNTAFYANTIGLHKANLTLLGLDGFQGSFLMSVTGAFPATVTTFDAHGLVEDNDVVIAGAGTGNGTYVATNVTSNTFEIDADSADFSFVTPNQPQAFGAYITTEKNGIINKYYFVGAPERFEATYKSKTLINPSSYFLLNSIDGDIRYCFWYDTTGSDPQPTLSGPEGLDRAFIKIDLSDTGKFDFTPTDVDVTANTITIASNGFVDDSAITFTSTDTLPSPLLSNTTYYVISATTDTFQVAATIAGPAIDLTTQGVGDQSVQNNDTVGFTEVKEATKTALEATGDFVVDLTTGWISTSNSGTTAYAGYPSGQNGPAGLEGLVDISIVQVGYGEDLANHYVRLSSLLSPAAAIEDTAKSLVKNIDNNTNEGVYAYYTPTSDALPGAILLESRTRGDVSFTVTAIHRPGPAMWNPDIRTQPLLSISERNPNKLYFSKVQQPEAVPLTNSLLIGPKDKAILRIIGLRDSLFILKEEGIYRLTGDNASNFTVSLFDNSATILAADTACVLNNRIYCLSTQGIITVDETGVGVVSRPIENIFLKLTSPAFKQYKTQSFAFGYEADRSYIIFVPKTPTDDSATECYRYNTFTQSWTSWDKTATCGVVETSENRLYTGAADIPAVEIERKDLTSRDYADRQYDRTINVYDFNYIYVDNTQDMVVGDMLTQTQSLSLYQYNKLVDKLNFDPIMNGTFTPFEIGTSMELRLQELVDELNATDASVVTETFDRVADIDPVLDRITITGHPFYDGEIVTFNGTPFDDGQRDYYIINPTANNFQISLTSGGAAVQLTQGAAGSATVSNEYIIGTPDYEDLGAAYNRVVRRLNLSPGAFFTDYPLTTGTVYYDLLITKVEKNQNRVLVHDISPFTLGPVVHYKAIKSTIVWAYMAFGNPSLSKHVREGVTLIESDSLATITVGYATDLSGNFEDIQFDLQGDGGWGDSVYGQNAWGGEGISVPMRTIIPRQKQRCRYIKARILHGNAMYKFSIMGIAYTYEPVSERAWK